MKVSYQWLNEFVDIGETPQQLGTRFTNVGMAVDALEKAGNDFVFELDVATNRPDCLSHFGVAREIAAIYGSTLRPPKFELREAEERATDVVTISISDPDLCARYCGRYIAGVKIGPSPEWLKSRLEALGVRSINNVADATNYVMLELGQPLHAFDADRLSGHQIIVRRSGLDEKMKTLDGVERELNPSILVIADATRAIASPASWAARKPRFRPPRLMCFWKARISIHFPFGKHLARLASPPRLLIASNAAQTSKWPVSRAIARRP